MVPSRAASAVAELFGVLGVLGVLRRLRLRIEVRLAGEGAVRQVGPQRRRDEVAEAVHRLLQGLQAVAQHRAGIARAAGAAGTLETAFLELLAALFEDVLLRVLELGDLLGLELLVLELLDL